MGLRANVALIDLHYTSMLSKHSVDIVNRVVAFGFGTPFWVSAPQLQMPRIWVKLPLEIKPWFLMVSFWRYGMLSNSRFCFFIEQLEKRKIKIIRRRIKDERQEDKDMAQGFAWSVPWSTKIAKRQLWSYFRRLRNAAFTHLVDAVEGIASKCLLFFFGTFFIRFKKKRRWRILPRILFGFGNTVYNEGARFNVPVVAPIISSSEDKPFIIPSNETLFSTALFFTGLFKNVYYKAFLRLRFTYMNCWRQKQKEGFIKLMRTESISLHLKLANKEFKRCLAEDK